MTEALLKGTTLGLLLAISVGPIVFIVIKQSIVNGHKGGFAFIAGISISDILLVTLSNVFTNLFDLLSAHKKMLSVVASVFLIIVGLYYLFFKKAKPADVDAATVILAKGDYIKLFVTGFIMNIFNPGIIVFWLTTATTFSADSINHRVTIFVIALLIALIADVLKVLLANGIRKKLTPKNIHLVNRINGMILVAFGIFIIFLG
jgi:threonine/homoserine/homoserine lactone efflux protein